MPNPKAIPDYLLPFVTHQDASLYTPIDHASWRYIMRLSQTFFKTHAHDKYQMGLKETGISTERIPLISEMNTKLSRFGWQAVGVSGFIPPAVFLEFISLGILPIACDMRTLDHLAYTPAPDIVHEAAGHAPIVADPQYAAYLKNYGEISRKAIFSKRDIDVYEAIRNLSDIKEAPSSTESDIARAQARLDQAIASVDYTSEATYLARMSWWTIEYGLVGEMSHPLIYGAGLLSSVGESYNCLSDKVSKLPFSLDCINTSYDITRPQPQLFVTPDFQTLCDVLEEFADTMAFRKGGIDGLSKAKRAETATTTVFDSGLQISGVLSGIHTDASGLPCYLQYKGPTQLSCEDQEIGGQGPTYHKEGFGTPVGLIKNSHKSAAQLEPNEIGKRLEFESGVVVEGKLINTIKNGDSNLILVFENCTVTRGETVLFRPEWGHFDMGCGGSVVSVFGGAADRTSYLTATGGYKQKPLTQKTNLTTDNKTLNNLYASVRKIRDSKKMGEAEKSELEKIHTELESQHGSDWLLRMELLELAHRHKLSAPWERATHSALEKIGATSSEKRDLITRGLKILDFS